MIKSPIGVHLREPGFRKRRNTFFRSTEHGWIAIDFQASQFGTREHVSFTINLAINFVELRTVDEDQPSLGKAHIDFQRIGSLLPDKRHDHWWKLDPEDNLDNVAREVIRDLDQYAIPWLEQRQIFSKTPHHRTHRPRVPAPYPDLSPKRCSWSSRTRRPLSRASSASRGEARNPKPLIGASPMRNQLKVRQLGEVGNSLSIRLT